MQMHEHPSGGTLVHTPERCTGQDTMWAPARAHRYVVLGQEDRAGR